MLNLSFLSTGILLEGWSFGYERVSESHFFFVVKDDLAFSSPSYTTLLRCRAGSDSHVCPIIKALASAAQTDSILLLFLPLKTNS
jgi:hypothetical protein